MLAWKWNRYRKFIKIILQSSKHEAAKGSGGCEGNEDEALWCSGSSKVAAASDVVARCGEFLGAAGTHRGRLPGPTLSKHCQFQLHGNRQDAGNKYFFSWRFTGRLSWPTQNIDSIDLLSMPKHWRKKEKKFIMMH